MKLFQTKGFYMQQNYKVGKFQLDDHQMQLLLNDTNSIVIAGAGSGKTLTITGKVNYLLENQIVKPEEILIISFTNASVNDIKAKINDNVYIFTFHKLAMFILEKLNYNYQICPENILYYTIEEAINTCNNIEQKIIKKFLNYNASFTNFLKSQEFTSFCKLIATFINLWKTNNLQFDDIPLNKYTKLERKILLFIFQIYQKYIMEKNSMQKLDFDDLILIATQNVKNISLPFKYIIIDEFQDTSLIRLNLIKKIFKCTTSKVIVVGDDWQSIYRFSGCDLNLFINFPQFFPNVNTIKLCNTYRNSQELINVAATFIEKNPRQITKDLISNKHSEMPFIFVPYSNKKETFKILIIHLLNISNDIMILTRNNKDIYDYLDSDFKLENNLITYQDKTLKFYTVHKSKGLEAEYVVVLNCNDETLGFPNKIENNPLIQKLYSNNEIKFAEERRLFYVAITRCKEKTYLMYAKDNPSPFIIEIRKIIRKTMKHISYFK